MHFEDLKRSGRGKRLQDEACWHHVPDQRYAGGLFVSCIYNNIYYNIVSRGVKDYKKNGL